MLTFFILFSAFSEALREPDPEFYKEAEALELLGIPWRVVNTQALIQGDVKGALRFFGGSPAGVGIFRGPILHPEEYSVLCRALEARGCRMLTSPDEYRRALLFPEFFPLTSDLSFPATWIVGTNAELALAAAERLGPPPYFIKDYSKSAKELWPDGCVVATASRMAVEVEKLVAYRGDRFEGGIVIRPLLRLRYLEENPFGGKIYEEYRLFFFKGVLISMSAYDRAGGPGTDLPDYSFLPQRIASPFFTADVVVTEAGTPYLLEIGDGGSSALPPAVQPATFYRGVLEMMKKLG